MKKKAKDERVVYFNGQGFVPAEDPIPGGFGGGGSPWALWGLARVYAWRHLLDLQREIDLRTEPVITVALLAPVAGFPAPSAQIDAG